MKHLIALLVLASLAIVGCADNSSQEPVSALSNDDPLPLGKRTPMKMRIVGRGDLDFAGRCSPAPTSNVVGTGNGTQLGNFLDIQSHCVSGPNADGSFDFYDGRSTIITPNGDELYSTYSGKLWPTSTPPLYRIDGYAFLVGGTGRFVNATGEQAADGILNFATGEATLTLDGWIERRP